MPQRAMASDILSYRTQGDPGSPALLLVHPLGSDHAFWDAAAALLAERFFCVACDLLSAGRSPVAGEPVPLARHVAALEALRSTLGLDSLVPVGCAIGGLVAAAFAARSGAHVPALVLANPVRRFSAEARAKIAERVEKARRAGLSAICDDIVGRAFHGLDGGADRTGFAQILLRQPLQGYADLAEGIASADVSADLARIGCPVLLLASANDVQLPLAIAEDVLAATPTATMRRVDAGSHFIPFQAPGAFAAEVREFLGAVMQPAGQDGTERAARW